MLDHELRHSLKFIRLKPTDFYISLSLRCHTVEFVIEKTDTFKTAFL
jgi:hypothetical protein